jgi:glycosyltransferase involved in cell wall biosynthesis
MSDVSLPADQLQADPSAIDQKPARHVAIYLHTFFNGGIERVMLSLAHVMVAQGVKVDLVVNFVGFSPMWKDIPSSISVIDLGANRLRWRLPRLLRYIRTSKPDCILTATHLSHEIAILAKLLSGNKLRVVVSEHSSLSGEFKNSPRSSRTLAVLWLGRLMYRFADESISVSEGVRRDVQKVFRLSPDKCLTIYNPVDVKHILASGEEPVEHPWFQPGGPPVIVSIGRLAKQKDIPNLLHAFAIVRKSHDVKLAILGEGTERRALTAKVEELALGDHVWMPGFVSNPYPYLKRGTLFVLSSAWEGFAIAIAEALAFNLPVVSTDCPSGPSEILKGGEYGILVPVNDSKALAEGISRVLRGERKHIPEDALAPYTVESVADQYLKALFPA